MSAPQPDPPARLDAEARREATLDFVARLFATRGFAGTTTADMARAAGISEAMLYKLFGDKRGIHRALLERKIAEGDELFPHEAVAARDDRAVFVHIADSILRNIHDDPDFLRLLLFSALEGDELSGEFYVVRVRELLDYIANYLRTRASEGALNVPDPDLAAQAFIAMPLNYAQTYTILAPAAERDWHHEGLAERFADLFLAGVLPR